MEVAVLQRADMLGDDAVEATDLLYLVLIHSLTLVRYLRGASGQLSAIYVKLMMSCERTVCA
jgi:hypothetical protein